VIKNPHATEIYEAMMRRLGEAFSDFQAAGHTNAHAIAQEKLDTLYGDIKTILGI
jgi:hypothetical protein